ncbi:MAG TPA: hypothetical protein VFM82_05050 [Flavobacteriaceae bacterium]|nr:hypothetical protein [Flavobacteriaceae bacterium]
MSAPFTSEHNRVLLSRILVIYSVFYVIMKIIAIFSGAWVVANLLLCIPLIGLGIWGGILLKRNSTNWLYVIVAVILISAIRYFEADLIPWLHIQITE